MSRRSTLVLAVASGLAVGVVAWLLVVRWWGARPSASSEERGPETRHSQEMDRRLAQLKSVPYTFLSEEQVGDEPVGVTLYDTAGAWRGYNLYCSWISPEVYLMDMTGEIVHTWTYQERKRMAYRNHAIMLAGGDLVVINDPRDVQKLDWQSNLIWKTSVASDHDVVQARDGTFRLIGFDIMPHRGLDVKFASILELDSGGKVSSRWSTRDHLDEIKHAFDTRSFFDNLIDAASAGGDTLAFDESVADLVDVNEMKGRNVYDYFHANTVGILPENPIGSIDRRFAAGNILICFRNVNQIALLDAHTKDILWAWGEGVLEWPHHPTMLASGNMLIFDNGVRRGYSRVLELNPATGRIEWEYVAPGTFYSPTRGSAQRLPNGNTLVCESDKGVAFEVTREGETVWRWVNPAVKLHRRVLVYRMERLPPETIEPLLARSRS